MLGVHATPHDVAWVLRRGDELVRAGVWVNPASVDVDGRRAVLPPPTTADLTVLLAVLDAASHGETPERVCVSPLALPTPGPTTGRVSKRALHSLPPVAAVHGALVGRYGDLVDTLSPMGTAALPRELRPGAAPSSKVGLSGARGARALLRTAWACAAAESADIAGADDVPSGSGVSTAVDVAQPTVVPAVTTAYAGQLLTVMRDSAPRNAAALAVAAQDALRLVPRPPGAARITAAALANHIARELSIH